MIKNLVLLIDTSLQGVSVATGRFDSDGFSLEASVSHLEPHAATGALTEIVKECLDRSGNDLDDVTDIVVGHGPGSFTGVKIGIAFAQGMKAGRPALNVYGVSSLKAMAAQKGPGAVYILPSNRLQGFVGIADTLYLCDVAAGFALMSAQDRLAVSPEILKDKPIILLQPWPSCELALKELNLAYTVAPMNNVAEEAIKAMAWEFARATPPEGRLEPLYLRESAPQEKLLAARKGP